MPTYWEVMTENDSINIKSCDWCCEDKVLYDTGICGVCEDCLKSEEYPDDEKQTPEERNA